jgi:hypothetical protein
VYPATLGKVIYIDSRLHESDHLNVEINIPQHFAESMPSRMRALSAMRDQAFVAIRPETIPLNA